MEDEECIQNFVDKPLRTVCLEVNGADTELSIMASFGINRMKPTDFATAMPVT